MNKISKSYTVCDTCTTIGKTGSYMCSLCTICPFFCPQLVAVRWITQRLSLNHRLYFLTATACSNSALSCCYGFSPLFLHFKNWNFATDSLKRLFESWDFFESYLLMKLPRSTSRSKPYDPWPYDAVSNPIALFPCFPLFVFCAKASQMKRFESLLF